MHPADLLGSNQFSVHWCGFWLGSSNLRNSSLVMVAALVRWSFGALARRLHVRLLQQVLHGFSDGGAKTAPRLRLALVLHLSLGGMKTNL
jgi:hypothetical protein